jgi:hypothetical protein
MYLFVFFWSPALKAVSPSSLSLPFGMIFACFMVGLLPVFPHYPTRQRYNIRDQLYAQLQYKLNVLIFLQCSVMLGSLLFSLLTTTRILSHTRLLTLLFATSSSSLLIPILSSSSHSIFFSFCLFELCVGLYFPCIGYLKGRFIEDGIRARVYGMLRIPLNAFVVVALMCVREGEEYRNGVFVVCSGLLVFVSGIFHHFVGE